MSPQIPQSFAVAIPHTPWVSERVESMQRLRKAVGQWVRAEEQDIEYKEFTDRAPNRKWSETMWRWGAQSDATHFLTLQDDVIAAPNFWPALRAMLEAQPDKVICLETVHPAAQALAIDGHRWMTTSDGLVGVGYVLPTALLREFLAWRGSALKEGALSAMTEDTLLALWCMSSGNRVWHPLPTIIDHDTSIPSTYANDEHPNRRPLVRWDTMPEAPLEHAQNWRQGPPAKHVGRLYEATPGLARTWLKDVTETAVSWWIADDGRQVKRRLSAIARLRQIDGMQPEGPRILLRTPIHGRPSPYYTSSVWDLIGNTILDVRADFELEGAEQRDQDVMRTRSRFVRDFLRTDCTHLLMVDADISFRPVALRGMLAADKAFVAAPYPSRDWVNWARAREGGEAAAYGYRVRFLEGFTGNLEVGKDGCAEVAGLGMGFALLRRDMLVSMTEHFREQLEIDDDDGQALVELFWSQLHARRRPSEDIGFCDKWREMGGKVWMYLGPGSPVTHHGDWSFVGHPERFGVRHA